MIKSTMKALVPFTQCSFLTHKRPLSSTIHGNCLNRMSSKRCLSTSADDAKLRDFMEYMDSLKNYEKSGVPKGAGTDSEDGFDLGRMRRLMDLLGNPQSKFKAIHVAGTKGKGSTAAFLSNILRAEGYSVGCYSSPHVLTIRERMSLGRMGEPVSAGALNRMFFSIKNTVDQAIQLEKGSLSHFEVLTAMAFALFAQENVEVAVIEAGLGGARDATNIIDSSGLAAAVITTIGEEHMAALGGSLESIAVAKSGIIKHNCPVVLGGPFVPQIECILRDKASSMHAPVISSSDAGSRSNIKVLRDISGIPWQCCDIDIQMEKDFKLSFKLSDVKLRMLGNHQLQNATTATCTALCLRELGWRISDGSIREGLEQTYLPGRSQFLTSKEVERLRLPGARILLDGAHTKDSAKALVETIKMAYPESPLALVVAMASDKDHIAFAKEFLSGSNIKGVILTEASIAGGKSRTTSAALLKNCWIQASEEAGKSICNDEITTHQEFSERIRGDKKLETVIVAEGSIDTSLQLANKILQDGPGSEPGIIVVTGSLHIVATVLSLLESPIN